MKKTKKIDIHVLLFVLYMYWSHLQNWKKKYKKKQLQTRKMWKLDSYTLRKEIFENFDFPVSVMDLIFCLLFIYFIFIIIYYSYLMFISCWYKRQRCFVAIWKTRKMINDKLISSSKLKKKV